MITKVITPEDRQKIIDLPSCLTPGEPMEKVELLMDVIPRLLLAKGAAIILTPEELSSYLGIPADHFPVYDIAYAANELIKRGEVRLMGCAIADRFGFCIGLA